MFIIFQDKILHSLKMDEVKDLKKESSFDEIIKMEEQHLIQFHEFSSQTDKNKVCFVCNPNKRVIITWLVSGKTQGEFCWKCVVFV